MDSNKKNWKNNVKKFQQNCSCVKVDCMRNLGSVKHILIDPPVEFQDNPIESFVEKFAGKFISKLISEAFMVSCKITWSIPCCKNCLLLNSVSLNSSDFFNRLQLLWSPELLAFKKSFSSVPACISVSQNSLSILSSTSTDHSEDNVTSKHITDMYNVPFDSDLYAVPVDVIHENFSRLSNQISSSIKRDKYYHSFDCVSEYYPFTAVSSKDKCNKSSRLCSTNSSTVKRPLCSSQTSSVEPVHVTVEEVRHYLNTFYSNQHEISENKNLNDHIKRLRNPFKIHQSNNEDNKLNLVVRNNYIPTIKNKKIKDNSKISNRSISKLETNPKLKKRSTSKSSFSTNVKETLCNMFRLKKLSSGGEDLRKKDISTDHEDFNSCVEHSQSRPLKSSKSRPPFLKRALPPVPGEDLKNPVNKIIPDSSVEETIQHSHYKPSQAMAPVDFASSIEKVKDCGWYWGPISSEAAEKILFNEPDGSFIVRDSSDDYYIFSLTFKLNSIIRHVRIEHDQGNFSFGSSTRFKSNTIVDFIESAVEHSRSGRYLFFLHRRPILGPIRVQLLHPVSRFKEVQTLQHMCRFVILKQVRRDLIRDLPLPTRILDYLSTQHYYSERMLEENQSSFSAEGLCRVLPFDEDAFS